MPKIYLEGKEIDHGTVKPDKNPPDPAQYRHLLPVRHSQDGEPEEPLPRYVVVDGLQTVSLEQPVSFREKFGTHHTVPTQMISDDFHDLVLFVIDDESIIVELCKDAALLHSLQRCNFYDAKFYQDVVDVLAQIELTHEQSLLVLLDLRLPGEQTPQEYINLIKGKFEDAVILICTGDATFEPKTVTGIAGKLDKPGDATNPVKWKEFLPPSK